MSAESEMHDLNGGDGYDWLKDDYLSSRGAPPAEARQPCEPPFAAGGCKGRRSWQRPHGSGRLEDHPQLFLYNCEQGCSAPGFSSGFPSGALSESDEGYTPRMRRFSETWIAEDYEMDECQEDEAPILPGPPGWRGTRRGSMDGQRTPRRWGLTRFPRRSAEESYRRLSVDSAFGPPTSSEEGGSGELGCHGESPWADPIWADQQARLAQRRSNNSISYTSGGGLDRGGGSRRCSIDDGNLDELEAARIRLRFAAWAVVDAQQKLDADRIIPGVVARKQPPSPPIVANSAVLPKSASVPSSQPRAVKDHSKHRLSESANSSRSNSTGDQEGYSLSSSSEKPAGKKMTFLKRWFSSPNKWGGSHYGRANTSPAKLVA